MWDVDFRGIGAETVTLLAGIGISAANEGHVAKVSAVAAKTAEPCDAEDVFYGVIDKFDQGGGIVALQRKGFKEVGFTGPVALGWVELVADGQGGVKTPGVPGVGRKYHVVDLDPAGTLVLDLG
ncbi:MAG: hypothetical protein CVU57_04305 [Deltaproteobacteria bacterium HGW-Deltaproteobacteria-15]|jgi:hypothetical protein|nr:MAG: hypothetical protein CVU57_04305 [Deltaproteobacteria bacterium HGW-Deltaproteobacteria-15]